MLLLGTTHKRSLIYVLALVCGLLMVGDVQYHSPDEASHKHRTDYEWALTVADQFPSAEITGLDLSPIQPGWVPPNVRFLIDDVEDDWIEGEDYDFINMRHSCAYLKDVDRLLKNCYDHLNPGGWVEFSDFGGYALCDDGTMPNDYPLNECFRLVREAMSKFGTNFLIANEHGAHFERAGFRNIQCRIVKTPIGIWPKVSQSFSRPEV